jgi:hypothetical protein
MDESYHADCSWVHKIASKDTSSRSQPYPSEGLYSIGSAFVLSASIRLLPLLCIQCRGSPLMNTYLQHRHAIYRFLSKNLRAARHYTSRKQNTEGRTKVNKSNGKKAQCICFTCSRYPISTPKILATLAFLLLLCVVVVIMRKHLHFQRYERRPLTRLNVNPNI